MKRVRSKRIENEKKLLVLREEEVDKTKLQEYSGGIFSTGVEKEEEEEHHLKEVILGREENIPTPVTQEHKEYPVKRRKIEINSSTPVQANPNSENSVKEHMEYLKEIEDIPVPEEVPLLSLRDDGIPPHLLSYVCFRKREVKSLRKARKSDTSIEKIKKIKVDLQMLKRLCELSVQRDGYLVQHLSSILSIFNICREMNKRLDIGVLNISESILKDILFTKLISKNDLFYKKIPSFTNLYTCRKSIGSLRKLFKSGPPPEEQITLAQKQIDYLNTF